MRIKILILLIFCSFSIEGKTVDQVVRDNFNSFSELKVVNKFIFLSSQDNKYLKTNSFHGDIPGYISVFFVYSSSQLIAVVFTERFKYKGAGSLLMITINNKGLLNRIDVLQTFGLMSYQPPKKWLKLFTGVSLHNTKRLKDIDALSGATITDDIIKKGVRNYLLLYDIVIKQKPE